MKEPGHAITQAPRYEIDAFLGAAYSTTRRPFDVAGELWGILESDDAGHLRPDTPLLNPETHFRDFIHFHCAYVGNGFHGLLDTSNGRSMFRRALIATREMQIRNAQAILEAAETAFADLDISIPVLLKPDWWSEDPGTLSEEVINTVKAATQSLTAAYWQLPVWPHPECVHVRSLDYLRLHRPLLLRRKTSDRRT